MNKYNNKKTVIDNITFDSKKEALRYMDLKLLQRAKKIGNLKMQPVFVLLEEGINSYGQKYREMTYIADFSYMDCEKFEYIVEDVKGMKTEVYNIKKKLFMAKYPNYRFIEC